ncbi:hypothetical protein ACIG56_27800 [Nocardia fusca]|uniref:hypothetical protein n=1 Tax=Nocardia fusca TaxID=941183 RepID=UPI0037CB3473
MNNLVDRAILTLDSDYFPFGHSLHHQLRNIFAVDPFATELRRVRQNMLQSSVAVTPLQEENLTLRIFSDIDDILLAESHSIIFELIDKTAELILSRLDTLPEEVIAPA